MPILILTPTFNTDTTVNRSGSDWNTGFTGIRLELGMRTGKGVLEKANFYQWHDMLIPKDSVINSATLRITADQVGRGSPFTCTVRGLDRDGLWNSDASGLDYRKAETVGPAFHFCDNQVQLFSGAMISELLTIAGNMNLNDNRIPINVETAWPRVTEIAQTITPTSTFTLTSASWAMTTPFFGSSPNGNVFLEIQSVDGAGKPTGVVLATSDTRLVSSIPSTLIALRENFLFSGADQVAITSGVKVAVVMNVTYPPSSTDFLESGVRGGLTNQYTGGELWSFGNGRGFDDNNYPCGAILEEDIGTTAASASMSVPFPSPIGTNVDTDVTAIIQETVDDAGYTSTGRMALAILPDSGTTQNNDIFNVVTTPLVGPILTIDFTAPALLTIPDVVGLTQAAAELAIVAAGFTVGTVTFQNSATVPIGDVISQVPVGGTMAAPFTLVDIVVSLGPSDRRDGGYTVNRKKRQELLKRDMLRRQQQEDEDILMIIMTSVDHIH